MSRRTIDYGIDLGTTNSSISVFEKGECHVFKNYIDEELTPSVVRIDESNNLVVGRKAYQKLHYDVSNTIGGFKRWMGTQQAKTFSRSGKVMTAEQLSAEVLKELKAAVRDANGEDISAAVITVPASFESLQCDATTRAARLAGINHSPLLQEPIAAAIAYAMHQGHRNCKWLFYDFGGGTFDVALVSFQEGRLSVIDHNGDNYLGGTNFDERIVDLLVIPYLKKKFDLEDLNLKNSQKYGALLATAKYAAENAKIELSRREEATIDIQFFDMPIKDNSGNLISAKIGMSRVQYEEIISKYIERTVQFCQELIQRQHLKKGDIEKVVLVGGPTKTPLLRKMLTELLCIPLEYSLNPMTVVAQGAAIFASAQFMPAQFVAVDVQKIQIQLQYEPLTNILQPLVGGQILDHTQLCEKYGQMSVQIKSASGDWISGRVAVQNDGFFAVRPHLNEGKMNVFYLTLFDEKGTALSIEPDSFNISHGLSVAEAPLIRSIGVGLENGVFSKHIEKGEPLPGRGRGEYHTTRLLRSGDDSAEGLNILVYEGENPVAEDNTYVGRIIITGKDVKRDIPENTRIEVLIKVDEQRHVTVEAEAVGQKIEGVIYDELGSNEARLAPKPDVAVLEQEIGKQKRRLAILKEKCDSLEENDETEAKIAKVEKEFEDADYERDIEAAKGGDQTACEKLEREVKELKALLEAAEYVNKWPMLIKEYQSAIQSCKRVVEAQGTETEKKSLLAITLDEESVIAHKDQKRLEKMTSAAWSLYWAVCMRQDEWWVVQFGAVQKGGVAFSDPERAKRLLGEGASALKRNDIESLKSVMWELWHLMSSQDQKEVSKRLEHSGLR